MQMTPLNSSSILEPGHTLSRVPTQELLRFVKNGSVRAVHKKLSWFHYLSLNPFNQKAYFSENALSSVHISLVCIYNFFNEIRIVKGIIVEFSVYIPHIPNIFERIASQVSFCYASAYVSIAQTRLYTAASCFLDKYPMSNVVDSTEFDV